MPLETGRASFQPADASVAAAFIAQSRTTLANALAKIQHCLDQLSDDDLQWRAHESHNSIQNLILHLCGNLRQWIGHGVGGAPDVRDRPTEFADRAPRTRGELRSLLREAVGHADAALVAFPAERLLERRTIQGFDTTVLAAVFDTVSHFVGHTHQIVYVARLRLGDAYRFQWVPRLEQGG